MIIHSFGIEASAYLSRWHLELRSELEPRLTSSQSALQACQQGLSQHAEANAQLKAQLQSTQSHLAHTQLELKEAHSVITQLKHEHQTLQQQRDQLASELRTIRNQPEQPASAAVEVGSFVHPRVFRCDIYGPLSHTTAISRATSSIAR